MRYWRSLVLLFILGVTLGAKPLEAQLTSNTVGASPSGSCGGDLTGSFPSCTVANITHSNAGSAAFLTAPIVGAITGWTALEQWQPHALPVVAGPTALTCTGTSGAFPFNDDYEGTLAAANVTVSLPTNGCANGSLITLVVTQGASAVSFTVTGTKEGSELWSIGTASGNRLTLQYQFDAPNTAWQVYNPGTYPVQALPVSVGGTGQTTATAGGDLSGTYPNPTIGKTPIGVAPETLGAKGDGQIVNDATLVPVVRQVTTNTTSLNAPEIDTDQANTVVVTAFGLASNSGTFTAPGTPTARTSQASSASVPGIWAGDTSQASVTQQAKQAATVGTTSTYAASSTVIDPSSGTVTFIAATSACAASGSAVTVNVPASTANGDLMVFINTTGGAAVTPAGTFVTAETVQRQQTSTSAVRMYVGKRTASSEPASYQLNSVATGQCGAILTYRNASMAEGVSSVQAAFVAGDATKLACMDAVATTNNIEGTPTDLCGTISTFTNAHLIVPSFDAVGLNYGNPDTNFDGNEFRWATDDTTAMQNALASLYSGSYPYTKGGGKLLLARKAYGLSATLSWPTGVAISVEGNTSTITSRSVKGGASFIPGMSINQTNGSALWWLTKSLSGPGFHVGPVGSASIGAYQQTVVSNKFAHFTMWAGAGLNWDGGSSTSDGIKFENDYTSIIEDVTIGNFGQNGVSMITSGSYAPFNGQETFWGLFVVANGNDGIKVDTAGQIQNFRITDSQTEFNGFHGVEIFTSGGSGNVDGMLFENNVFQRTNAGNNANAYEIQIGANVSIFGCFLNENYFEDDVTSGNHVVDALHDTAGQCNRMAENDQGANAETVYSGLAVSGYHVAFVGTAPTITASGGTCGTSDAVTAGSTDQSGQFETGTSGTVSSCVVSFAKAFTNAPTGCIVEDVTGNTLPAFTAATGTLTVTIATNSHFVNWWCPGPRK